MTLKINTILAIDEACLDDFLIKLNQPNNNEDLIEQLAVQDEDLIEYLSYHKTFTSAKAHFVMNKPYVIQFIRYPRQANAWIFAGVFELDGVDNIVPSKDKTGYIYKMKLVPQHSEYIGRLIVRYKRKAGHRNIKFQLSQLNDEMEVLELLPTYLENNDFPGYEDVLLTHDQLKRIITTNNISWKAALSNVKGIYLQLDKATGKQYVGSAYGSDMLWGRLSSYAHTYHGGNKDLRKLFDEKGSQYFTDNFSYALLETFKSSVDDSIIIRREHRWMEILGTKKHGYNN